MKIEEILGYATGVASGLALLCGLGYSMENPQRASVPFKDTYSSIVRAAEKPEGYIGKGNALEVLADAAHDLGQRNPGEALEQFGRLNMGFGNTPYQDQKLRSSQYKNSQDLVRYADHELDEKVLGVQKSDWIKMGSGLGLGLLVVGALASRNK